jgi:hypothetical protein
MFPEDRKFWKAKPWTKGRPATLQELIEDMDPDGELRKSFAGGKGRAEHKSQPALSRVTTGFATVDSKLERRVRGYLLSGKPAKSGDGGHNRTLEAAQGVVNGFLLSREDAIHMMMAHFVPRSPADDLWSLQEIEHKVDEAFRVPCNHPRGWLINAENPNAPRRSPAAAEPVGHRPAAPTSRPGLPTVVQQPAQLRDVVQATLEAVVSANDPLSLFVHADQLVRVDAENGPAVKALSKAQVRLLVTNAANFVNESATKEGEPVHRAAFPKGDVIDSIQEHGQWPGVPRLVAVADVPLITAESGLLHEAGYDAASGVYLLPGGLASVPEVKDSPTEHDVECARRMILEELLGDFPFADDASRANALALFMLPFVRGLINGSSPLHHIDAPQEGTGKSLFIQTWGHVCEGREPAAIAEVTRADDWQKLVLAALMEAPRSVFLDNLNHTLDSGPLAQAITSGFVRGRLLGYSRVVTAKANCVWVSTGNNVAMSREMVRRTLYIRLDAKQDTAWNGRKFRHKLPQWAELNRGELVWACLTLCQAWVAKGKPAGRSRIGGFEAWSAVIDGILCNAGITDLAGNADEFRNVTVDSGDEWRAFVPAWWQEYQTMPVTSADLARLADSKELLCVMLEKAMNDRSRSTKIGLEIKKVRERVYDGIRIQCAGKNHKGHPQYKLEPIEGAELPEPNDLLEI